MNPKRISKELVAKRYYELLAGGKPKDEAAKTIGMLVLNFYRIDFHESAASKIKKEHEL